MLGRVAAATGLDDARILCAFRYGSRVYGTHRADSDHDFIVIAEGVDDGREYREGDLNIHTYTPGHFAGQVQQHRISALECLFLPPDMILRSTLSFPLVLGRASLRSEISAKASHSFVKARKKLEVENEVLAGRKSLFHALRILDFGIQMASHGRISDYGSSNELFAEIMDGPRDWPSLKQIWQPRYNAKASAFRLLTPKG